MTRQCDLQFHLNTVTKKIHDAHTESVVDFDGLSDVSRVRFASSVHSEDPENILLSIIQTCHHKVKVGALLWGLVGLNPLHSTRLLVFN